MAKAKRHWTQTLEGREHMRQVALKRYAKKHKGKNKNSRPTRRSKHGSTGEEAQVAYLFGRLQGFIHAYAEGHGADGRSLAQRVGELLRHS